MKFYMGSISRYVPETYNIYVILDGELSGREINASVISSGGSTNNIGSSGMYAPEIGARCAVIEHDLRFYILGYTTDLGGAGASGVVVDPDKYPLISVGEGDSVSKHRGGNYLKLGHKRFEAISGIGARMYLVGGSENLFSVSAMNFKFNNTCGGIDWTMAEDDSATFNMKIQSGFESSDVVNIRAGSIYDSEGDGGNFEMDVINDTNGSNVYLSLGSNANSVHLYTKVEDTTDSKIWEHSIFDDTNELLLSEKFNLDDSLKWETSINFDGRYIIDVISENNNVSFRMFDEENDIMEGLFINEVYTRSIESSGKVFIKNEENYTINSSRDLILIGETVNLGAERGTEQLALGNSLVQAINTLIDSLNTHTHPTGTGPSGPPLAPLQNIIESNVLSNISRSS